jgi:Replication-relaxation
MPSAAASEFKFDGVDHKYLQAFGRYHYLTAKHVTKLFYKAGSFTTVAARLKKLSDNEYLLPLALPTIRAKSPFVYTLATKGREYVEGLGIELPLALYRPSREHEKGYQFFSHTLAINDFLIAAEVLTRLSTGVRIEEMLHDLSLKHDPPYLAVGAHKGKKIALVPDAWVDFRVKREGRENEARTCVWLELDQGTMSVKPLKKKIGDLVALYEQGGYKDRFGTRSVVFAFATTDGDRRVEYLRKWIREQLQGVVGDDKAKSWWFTMFVVCSLPSEINPKDLFLEKFWYLVRESTPKVSLLKLE